MRIVFIKPYTVLDGTGTRYDVGQELTCSEASAEHFIRRNVAEVVKRMPRKKADPVIEPDTKQRSN